MPACGWALGMERLAAASNLKPADFIKTALIKVEGAKIQTCRRLASKLRKAGVAVSEDYEEIDTGKKFKITDKNNIKKVLIIGGDEEKNGAVTLRDMKTGSQTAFPLDNIEELVRKIDA